MVNDLLGLIMEKIVIRGGLKLFDIWNFSVDVVYVLDNIVNIYICFRGFI